MTLEEGNLHLVNNLPKEWQGLSYRMLLQQNLLEIKITKDNIDVEILEGPAMDVMINGNWQRISPDRKSEVVYN
ncbi:glycosyl hydrolase family 65 protein [Companilactobacillus versmoldensis]|nr:glycosyl hydrolase family 65 protein [Companilactobacillus versmoldensis]